MRLIFKQPHLSITTFAPVELAPFSVITGVNGSGKSHLLQAIEMRHVQVEGHEQAAIVRFDYETFKLENESAFNSHQLVQERESAWQLLEQQIRGNVQNWRKAMGEDYQKMVQECSESHRPLWDLTDFDQLDSYKKNIHGLFQNKKLKGNQQAQGLYSFIKSQPRSIDEIQRQEFLSLYKPYSFKNDFLPNQLGRVIWDYYEKYQRNRFNAFQNKEDGLNLPALEEDEFRQKLGEKPWVLINEILRGFDSLDYEITSPEGTDYFANYQIKLQSRSDLGLRIDFANLSSGEQVLMALVAAVYKTVSDKHFPELLLLDEIDSSLHPSMLKNLLDVIEEVFLSRDVTVLLVTHSPTTIALAPEDSIFVMSKQGPERLEKATRSAALDVLTQGFATLERACGSSMR
ncbi:MAG: ATP-binding protein [Nitrososphaerales archaeon]